MHTLPFTSAALQMHVSCAFSVGVACQGGAPGVSENYLNDNSLKKKKSS